ncbi:MAG: orotate phosphoribosyltransferase [Candidatus Mesenet longicola]|uniref:Orotate phosphoribosyltransferase n=1 Tax=Candidatus Mesenet longicola TaxID=1892558 RepID=A0A8J3HUY0_9RICK|nr:MAG: orotate phosphoribosyltransferase [Candidatus Mesenet longicola]GHM59474.1 MAG: orotate phosphoribosyltransferase [Candidatus Mesenet longicola]
MLNKKNCPIIQEFIESGAILEGHFILSSGLHSSVYVQCAKLFERPSRATKVCKMLVDKIHATISNLDEIDLILSPAIGGIVVGYEVGRQLGINSIFCERIDGKFALRRGFEIQKGDKILIVEDVITTGKSSLETAECAKEYGGEVIAEAALIDRSSETCLPFPVISLLDLNIQNYTDDNIPEKLKLIPPIKPGSRHYLSKNAT